MVITLGTPPSDILPLQAGSVARLSCLCFQLLLWVVLLIWGRAHSLWTGCHLGQLKEGGPVQGCRPLSPDLFIKVHYSLNEIFRFGAKKGAEPTAKFNTMWRGQVWREDTSGMLLSINWIDLWKWGLGAEVTSNPQEPWGRYWIFYKCEMGLRTSPITLKNYGNPSDVLFTYGNPDFFSKHTLFPWYYHSNSGLETLVR